MQALLLSMIGEAVLKINKFKKRKPKTPGILYPLTKQQKPYALVAI